MDDGYLDMSPEELQELLAEFLTEGENHLQVLNEKLLQAEEAIKSGTDMPDEDLNAMFRAAHTIKGTASFINLKKIVELTHEMETILQRVKEREMPLTAPIIDVLFKGFDNLESLFESVRDSGEEEGEIEESVKLIREILHGGQAAEKVPQDKTPKKEEAPAPELKEEKPEPEKQEQADARDIPQDEVNEKYLQQFIMDAEENVENFDTMLIKFEESTENVELVNDLFRFMHTVKGSAGIVNATSVQKLAHAMENLLSYYREHQSVPPEEAFALLFEGIDTIKDRLVALKSGEQGTKFWPDLVDELNAFNETLINGGGEPAQKEASVSSGSSQAISVAELPQEIQTKIKDYQGKGEAVYCLYCELEEVVKVREMKVVLIEERLKKEGTVLLISPPGSSLKDDLPGSVFISIYFAAKKDIEEVRGFMCFDGVKLVSIEMIEGKTMAEQSAPQEEAPKQEQKSEPKTEQQPETPQPAVTQAKEKKAPPAPPAKAPVEISTIRVDSHKIDNLMNLSGELVITRARFSQLVNRFNNEVSSQKELQNMVSELKSLQEIIGKDIKGYLAHTKDESSHAKKIIKTITVAENQGQQLEEFIAKSPMIPMIHSLDEVTSALGKIASDIQSGVMQTRMIPIEGIFTRFKRVVRDISKTLQKEVNLVIEGEDTELDKKIVDSLGDPLTHMIRNACDHGIESKEDRIAVGKDPVGTVFLRASHKGNNIVIEIGDDGKGLDADKIVESAIKKEIITPEQAEKMEEKEKLHLIFAPGFSTAKQVTGLSGRGVGMDVVKNMINSVNGIVDIETTVGKGTSFQLKIPLTLAIIQALLVVVGEETFAFPLDTVIEIIKVSPEDIYSIDGNDTVKLRGHALSVVELENVIGIEGRERDPNASKKIVVITDSEQQIGVVVDSLIGEDEIVIKSLTDHFAGVNGVTGASILGDGRIALILDPIMIIRETK